MIGILKNKKPLLLIGLLILLGSCEYEPYESSDIGKNPQKEIVKLESYYNQKSGIVFRWGDYQGDPANSHSSIMNNLSGKQGWYGHQAYGDVNKDGFQDILTTHWNSENDSDTNWYINSGDNKTFTEDAQYINSSLKGLGNYKILKTDVNNDSLADYVLLGVDERIPGDYGGNFTVLIQNKQGKFDVNSIDEGKGLWYHTGASGDLDGDGFVDIVTATYIWLGDGTGNFINTNISVDDFGIKPALSYEIIDINKDGYNDIIVGTMKPGPDMYGSNSSIMLGKPTFGEYDIISLPTTETNATLDFEFLDYDNDGDLDILELRNINAGIDTWSDYSYIHLYENDNLTFTLNNELFKEAKDGGYMYGSQDKHGWSRFKIDDIDNDGVMDIVAENYQDGYYNGLKKITGEWKKHRF